VVLGEIPLDQVSPAQARLNFHKSFALLKNIGGIFEKVESVRELTIPGPAGEIPARVYNPGKGTTYPLFVFLHGGGWVIGDLDSAENLARFLCRHVNCVVLSVDYRLSPEHVFPAAVDDSFAAVQWAVEHAAELGGDPKRVLVGGDSAGGNLAAVVAQMSRQKGAPKIAGQVLFYAVVDAANLDTPSYKELGEKSLGLPTTDMEWFLEQYTPEPKDRLNAGITFAGRQPARVATRPGGDSRIRRAARRGRSLRPAHAGGWGESQTHALQWDGAWLPQHDRVDQAGDDLF